MMRTSRRQIRGPANDSIVKAAGWRDSGFSQTRYPRKKRLHPPSRPVMATAMWNHVDNIVHRSAYKNCSTHRAVRDPSLSKMPSGSVLSLFWLRDLVGLTGSKADRRGAMKKRESVTGGYADFGVWPEDALARYSRQAFADLQTLSSNTCLTTLSSPLMPRTSLLHRMLVVPRSPRRYVQTEDIQMTCRCFHQHKVGRCGRKQTQTQDVPHDIRPQKRM